MAGATLVDRRWRMPCLDLPNGHQDLGHWSLPGIVRWRYAGAAKLLGETPQAAADQLRRALGVGCSEGQTFAK